MTKSETLPEAKLDERVIAQTVLENGKAALAKIENLKLGEMLSQDAKDIIGKARKSKTGYPPVGTHQMLDRVGSPLGTVVMARLPELVENVKLAAWRRECYLLAKKFARASQGKKDDDLKKLLDPLAQPVYPLQKREDRKPTSWADQMQILPEIEWAWDRWLPKGMLTMIIGPVEVGKSALALKLCQVATEGTPWPDGSTDGEPGLAVWAECENAEAINFERAKAWGIDPSKMLTPNYSDDPLKDLDLLTNEGWADFEAALAVPNVKIAVVDSLGGAYFRENDPEVKRIIKKLSALAKISQVPIIVIHHPRKLRLGEHDSITLDRIRGFSGIIQFPRLIWAVERPDPKDETVRVKVIKSNLGTKPSPFGFEWIDNLITWCDPPEEVKIETQADKAADLVMSLLAGGPVYSRDLIQETVEAGYAERTVMRAKRTLGIVSVKKDGRWLWSLPGHEQKELFDE